MDENTAQQLLERLVNQVIEIAPIYSEKMERIKFFKSKSKSLINDEKKLMNAIRKEKQFIKHYERELNEQNEGKLVNIGKLDNNFLLFKEEVINNAKIAEKTNQLPLILGDCKWDDIVLNYIIRKSKLIKEHSEILKKIDKLRDLQQNVFGLYDYDIDELKENDSRSKSLNRFLINPESNFSQFTHFFEQPYLIPVKQLLLNKQAELNNLDDLIQHSLASLTNELSQISASPKHQTEILTSFSPPIQSKLLDFEITQSTADFASKVNELIIQIHQSFEHEKSIIDSATKEFCRNNPQVQSSSSILCSNVIFEVQEQLRQAQNLIVEIGQQLLTPENKAISDIQQIDLLFNEIYQLLCSLIDKYKRSQIITQKFSHSNHDQQESDFEIEAILQDQIDQCQSKLDEMRSFFEKNLDINKSFIHEVDHFVNEAKDIQPSKSAFDFTFDIASPKLNDDSQIKREFLEIRNRILAKQAEQIDMFTKMLEELPPEAKQITNPETNDSPEIASKKTGYQFPSQRNGNEVHDGLYLVDIHNDSEQNEDETDDKQPQDIFSFTPTSTHTNPYHDSNQNLYEQFLQKSKRQTSLGSDSSISKKFRDSMNVGDIQNQYVKPIDDMTEELNSHISDENIDDLVEQRKELLETLKRKKDELNLRKNDKNQSKINEMDKLRNEKDKNSKLKEQIEASNHALKVTTDNLHNLVNSIEQLDNENRKLKREINLCNLRKTRYQALVDSISEIEEKQKAFDDF